MDVVFDLDTDARVEAIRIPLVSNRLDADEGEMTTAYMDELGDGIGLVALAPAHRSKTDDRFSHTRMRRFKQSFDLASYVLGQGREKLVSVLIIDFEGFLHVVPPSQMLKAARCAHKILSRVNKTRLLA